MPISAQIRDEGWNIVESSDLATFNRLSNRAKRLGKPMLSALEPYGLTVFNSRQLPELLIEAEDIWREEPDEIEAAINELRRLSKKLNEGRFHLLVFIGD